MKSYAAMNEGMLEIKAMNWILSLLYMLILGEAAFILLFTQRLMLRRSSSTATASNF